MREYLFCLNGIFYLSHYVLLLTASKIDTVPINECVAATTFVKHGNTVLWKNIFPVNTRSRLQRNFFF